MAGAANAGGIDLYCSIVHSSILWWWNPNNTNDVPEVDDELEVDDGPSNSGSSLIRPLMLGLRSGVVR